MAKTIILLGEPKSTQHIYRATCRGKFPTTYMTAEGKAIKEAYQWEAKSQWKGKPLEGDIDVTITLYFGTKRRADLDNFNKLSLDALTDIAYLDDSQIAKLTIERAYDKARPRIEIAVGQAQAL
ncbi:MAG TPA: RusA family crossover junction endodeoxyribonuclease [Candidatus Acidoferrum sp.]|jgi:Holliday junction resolvase RusA-like endonuclease|nr:RusA family crossover junction endodeoxyribonuclease [Candidatus Acidoferrum sp.]